jgi:hypothetical protein
MPRKLEILTQVMLSLKSDQNSAMNDINSLLNNRDKEVGLVDNIKERVRELSLIHSDMEETQAFIIQITQNSLGDIPQEEDKETPKG